MRPWRYRHFAGRNGWMPGRQSGAHAVWIGGQAMRIRAHSGRAIRPPFAPFYHPLVSLPL